jgi:HlyD family secretion protein
MRFHQRRPHLGPIVLGAALLATMAACSSKPTNTYQGYVEGKFVYVASPEGGRLNRLAVSRGETIAARHPLFELDDQPESDAERQAEQTLRSSEARLADLQTGKRPQEIDVTRAQLTQAQAENKKSVEILDSYEKQYAAGGIALVDLINARAAVQSSAATVQQLENEIAVAALPAREQSIIAQQREVAAARQALSQAEWKRQQKQIASPRDGLIFDTLYREGEWVAAGNPVVEILPPENLEVRFFVPETLVGRLKIGQNLSVHCDGCAADVPANITFISPQAEYTPPVIYSNENRSKLVYMVIAKPPADKAAALHPGQPIEVALR